MNEFNEFENAIDHQLNLIENTDNIKLDKDKEIPLHTPFYDKDIVKERSVNSNGELKIINYVKGKFIGKGGFAKCYEFLNLETNKLSAVKIIDKSTLGKWRSKQKLISEIKIHRSLDNPHIVKFLHFFEDSENVYLLLEICHNQSLNELLKRRKRITEFEAQFYLYQTVMAIKYLHSQKIVHRDLKLGNLFIADKMLLKLGDFGLATKIEYEGQRKRTVCGTPNYIAPEILEGKNGHSYEVDIWSIGIILYALLVGKPPFESKDVRTTYKKIKSGIYIFPENLEISKCAKNLIRDILVADPNMRPSLDQIMRYEFFQVGSIPKIMPMSTLACPPNLSFIKNFWPDASENGMAYFPCNKKNLNKSSSHDTIFIKSEYVRNITLSTINEENSKNKDCSVSIPKSENNYVPINNLNSMCYPEKIIPSHTHHNNEIFVVKNGSDEIYVIRWIDLSSRYGIGYLLSNDSIGVYFNDSTKIVLDPQGNVFHYIEKKGPNRQEIMAVYSIDNHPEELKKKITLLNRFKKNLQVTDENIDPNIDPKYSKTKFPYKSLNHPQVKSNEFVYVKKWMTTKNATLFRLSNKIIQVCFNDETELILNSNKREVVYTNKEKQRIVYPISNAMNSNNLEMVQRLKYVKDLLNHMLSLNASANVKAANEKKVMEQNVLYPNKNLDNSKNIKPPLMKQNLKTNQEFTLKGENFWR